MDKVGGEGPRLDTVLKMNGTEEYEQLRSKHLEGKHDEGKHLFEPRHRGVYQRRWTQWAMCLGGVDGIPLVQKRIETSFSQEIKFFEYLQW